MPETNHDDMNTLTTSAGTYHWDAQAEHWVLSDTEVVEAEPISATLGAPESPADWSTTVNWEFVAPPRPQDAPSYVPPVSSEPKYIGPLFILECHQPAGYVPGTLGPSGRGLFDPISQETIQ